MDKVTEAAISAKLKRVKVVGLSITCALMAYGVFIRHGVIEDARSMLAEGSRVSAVVVDKKHWIEYGRKNREIDKYALVYEFADASGIKHSHDLQVRENQYNQTMSGSSISVIYRPGDPDHGDSVERYLAKASIVEAIKDLSIILAFSLAMTFGISMGVGMKMRKQMAMQPAS